MRVISVGHIRREYDMTVIRYTGYCIPPHYNIVEVVIKYLL